MLGLAGLYLNLSSRKDWIINGADLHPLTALYIQLHPVDSRCKETTCFFVAFQITLSWEMWTGEKKSWLKIMM